MIDLNKIVNDTLVELEQEKFVEKVVKTRLEKTIEDIVDETFRGWSTFGKKLKNHVEENLNVDIQRLNLQGYNTMVLNEVEKQLDSIITTQGIEKMKENLQEMLSNAKKEYTLSEIIEEFKADINDKDDCGECITLHIEKSYSSMYIYLDEEEDKYKYSCAYKICLDTDRDGKVWSVRIKDKEFKNTVIMGGLYGIDKLLFKIYSSGAKIILDKGIDPDMYDTGIEYEDDEY